MRARSSIRCAGRRGEALQLLRDVPQLESGGRGGAHAGGVARQPSAAAAGDGHRRRASRRPGLGQDALLDFRMEVTLDGEPLTAAEIRELLAKSDGLALVRGRWVEVDREQLQRMIERFRRSGAHGGRERAGLRRGDAAAGRRGRRRRRTTAAAADADWAQVVAGPWLAETLKGLRSPEGLAQIDPGDALQGTLRPYQQVGVRWLYLLAKLGLGACLADDMGLGKTIQVLSLLLVLKRQADGTAAAKPAGGAGFAAGQLGGGNRTLRARVEGADRASVRDAGSRTEGLDAGAAAGDRPGDHQLRLAAARAVDRGSLLAAGGAGRSAGHQESRTPSRPAPSRS